MKHILPQRGPRAASSAAFGSALLGVVGMTILAGCTYPERGAPLERLAGDLGVNDVDEGYDPPVMRLGTMPFDAWYSPLEPLGIEDLGDHVYVGGGLSLERLGETSRGTLYTTRGGFIDIAHARNAIDLTRFVYDHVYRSLKEGKYDLDLLSAEPDIYHLVLTPPPAWTDLDPDNIPGELDEQLRDASVAIAGRMSYMMTSWHEVLTHYGYKGMGVITEKPSAFSFDDAASHRVGVEAAMRALHRAPLANPEDFNAAVTETLAEYLTELGAVPADQVEPRSQSVRGTFWDGSDPRLRVVDLGMDDQPLHAVVTDDTEPVVWGWSDTESVGGYPIEALYDVTIEMKVLEAPAVLKAIGKEKGPVHPRSDFPALAAQLHKELGPQEAVTVAKDE